MEPSTPQSGARRPVLYVDDDSTLRSLVIELLEEVGHEVLTASNGSEALALADEHDFGVVLSDEAMPLMGGQELFAQLVERDYPARRVLVSGSRFDGDNPLFDALLEKPFDFDELVSLVARLQDGSSQHAEH